MALYCDHKYLDTRMWSMCETMDDYYLYLQHCHIDCSLDVLQVVLDFSPLRRAQEILRSAAVIPKKENK